MKVSLIATVKDAAPHVPDFLDSVEAQTRAPDEVVIVDGGSTDGTVELLRERSWATVLEEPGANIARGRNLAVAKASFEAIAVSDADCVLEPNWLEEIVRPLERGADVSMGLYRPLATSFFEQCAAAVSIKDRDEIRAESYLPSARSVAFLRDAFDDAGGYPEWLEIGEDMYLNQQWRARGARMRLAEGAVVLRRPRPDVVSYWRQFTAYAEGDALAGMLPHRHAARFGAYGLLALALGSRSKVLRALVVTAGAAYASRPVRRAFRRIPDPTGRLASLVAVPAMMALNDVAKMAGYLRGLARSGRTG